MKLTVFFLIISFFSIQASTYQQSVSGVVTDNNGQPIPGVSIVEKGTSNGVAADFDGNYSITVSSADAILTFSSIGFTTQEISVGQQTKINVQLAEDTEALSEVVVVAYGTSSKKDLTGAISVINSEEINTFPATTVDQALQGKTAGVQITSNSGAPGASVTVNIRGVGSFGSTTPLYIVDGFPTRDINFINPNTIQSISVLKDASATALYGVRASNGVVIIETKKGKKGKIQVEMNSFISIRSEPKAIDVLDVNTFAPYALSIVNDPDTQVSGNVSAYEPWNNPGSLRNINWQDEIFDSAISKSTNLSVRGGGEKSRVAFNAGIFDEEGTLIGSKYIRYDIGLNASFDITDKLKVRANTKYVSSQNFQPLGTGRGSLLNVFATIPHLALAGEANDRGGFNPTNLPVDANGNFGAFPDGSGQAFRDGQNWVARALERDEDNVTNNVLANIAFDWEMIDGLFSKLNIGARVDNFSGWVFLPEYYRSAGNIDVRDDAEYTFTQNVANQWLLEYILQYKKTIAERHKVDVLGGVSAQRTHNKFSNVQGIGFLNNTIRDLSGADRINFAEGFFERETLASTFARFNYNFDSKYYVTGTVRRDGVGNRFNEDNLFGVFPSFAVGWNIDEEGFMDDSVFNILKFRGGWGETGNFDGIDPFSFSTVFSNGTSQLLNSSFSFGGMDVLGLSPRNLPNPNLSWETQTQSNIGLEGELLNNNLYFIVDYFNKTSSNFLFFQSVPSQSGFQFQAVNGGEVVNKGLELLIGFRKTEGDFTYDINANFTTIDNEVTRLDTPTGEVIFPNEFLNASFNQEARWAEITRTAEGGEVGAFYGFVAEGIFNDQAELDALNAAAAAANGAGTFYQDQQTSLGDRRFKDLNGDGKIDGEDRQVIGSPVADFYGSLNLNFSYKNFDVGFNFYGSYGNEILNLVKRELESASGYGNNQSLSNISTEYFNNRWTPDNRSDTYARALVDDGAIQNNRASSYFVEDGSYLRLRSLNIGYSLPSNLMEKLNLTSVRIYGIAQNVFTLTKYSGLDPEIGQNTDINDQSSVTTRGIDAGAYPVSRTFTLGLNLKF